MERFKGDEGFGGIQEGWKISVLSVLVKEWTDLPSKTPKSKFY
jgi:hypothetical protein